MDQVKIGKFISEVRKQRNLTQKELAEKLGVSDKTISKWECGNSAPDISYLEALCNSLGISVNELLSGEYLSDTSYSEKAEENIMQLMKENQINKKSSVFSVVLGVILGGVALVFMFCISGVDYGTVRHYFDAITVLAMVMLGVAGVLISGKRKVGDIINILQKIIIPIGAFVSLFQFVILLGQLDDPSTIGPNIAVCVLAMLYGVGTYLVLTIVRERGRK